MERWVQGLWFERRFTTEEHMTDEESSKDVRMRHVGPKSRGDFWSHEEIDKMKGPPWVSSVPLTSGRLR